MNNITPIRRDYLVSNKDKSATLDLRPMFEGKSEAVTRSDKDYLYEGQPRLMEEIFPAIKARCAALQNNHRTQAYLNNFLTFLTQERKGQITLKDVTQELLAEHYEWNNQRGSLNAYFCSPANNLWEAVHAQYQDYADSPYPNLISFGKAIKYPKFETTAAAATLDAANPIQPEHMAGVKQYCVEILDEIDTQNPFIGIVPEYGEDNANKAHVLYDYLQFETRLSLSGGKGSWSIQPAKSFPWKSIPHPYNPETKKNEGTLACGGYPSEMQTALFPSLEECIATLFLTTIDTGFTDAAKQIGTNPFFSEATHEDRPKSGDVLQLIGGIAGARPKTGRPLMSRHINTKKGGAYWALTRYLKRAERLREIMVQKLDAMQVAFEEEKHALSQDKKSQRVSEINTLKTQIQHALIYVTAQSRKPRSAQSIGGKLVSQHMRAALPDDGFTYYDLRHGFAQNILNDSNNIFEVSEALGHANIMTTLDYLRSHSIRSESFEKVARITGIVYDEIRNKWNVNIDVISQRYSRDGADLSEEERSQYRPTLVGSRCRDPQNPPDYVADGLGNIHKGFGCQSRLCILCHNSIWNVKEKGFAGLASVEIFRLERDVKNQKDDEKRYFLKHQLEAWRALLDVADGIDPNIRKEIENKVKEKAHV